MKNMIKVALLSSIITAAMVYVLVEWRPLQTEHAHAPEVSWASSTPAPRPEPAPAPGTPTSEDERNNIEVYKKYSPGVVYITSTTIAYDFFFRAVPQSGTGSGAIIDSDGHIVT